MSAEPVGGFTRTELLGQIKVFVRLLTDNNCADIEARLDQTETPILREILAMYVSRGAEGA